MARWLEYESRDTFLHRGLHPFTKMMAVVSIMAVSGLWWDPRYLAVLVVPLLAFIYISKIPRALVPHRAAGRRDGALSGQRDRPGPDQPGHLQGARSGVGHHPAAGHHPARLRDHRPDARRTDVAAGGGDSHRPDGQLRLRLHLHHLDGAGDRYAAVPQGSEPGRVRHRHRLPADPRPEPGGGEYPQRAAAARLEADALEPGQDDPQGGAADEPADAARGHHGRADHAGDAGARFRRRKADPHAGHQPQAARLRRPGRGGGALRRRRGRHHSSGTWGSSSPPACPGSDSAEVDDLGAVDSADRSGARPARRA